MAGASQPPRVQAQTPTVHAFGDPREDLHRALAHDVTMNPLRTNGAGS